MKSSRKTPGRDASPIANRRLPLASVLSDDPNRFLSETDRRTFVPSPPSSRLLTPYRPAQTLSGRPVRLRAVPAKQKAQARLPSPQRLSWSAVGFVRPQRVAVCVRRGVRREVLHALKVAGRRGLSGGRRSEFSSIRC